MFHLASLTRRAADRAKSSVGRRLLLALLGSGLFIVHAQQEPDYSGIDDFMHGERKLMSVQDLTIFAVVGNDYSNNDLKTNNSNIVNTDTWTYPSKSGLFAGIRSFSANMFHLPRAITIHVNEYGNIDYMTGGLPRGFAYNLPDGLRNPRGGANDFTFVSGAVADFNRDGYDDIAFFTQYEGTPAAAVAVAADVNAPIVGFRYGPIQFGISANTSKVITGDFNGDGWPEIARLRVTAGKLWVEIWVADPSTLALSMVHSLEIDALTGGDNLVSITSGRFTASANDQIVLAYAPGNNSGGFLKVLDFEPGSLQPQQKSSIVIAGNIPASARMKVATGKFDVASGLDQLIFVYATLGRDTTAGTKYVELINIDPDTLQITRNWERRLDFSGGACLVDIAVGNFDHRQPDPVREGETEANPNEQIALLAADCTSGRKTIAVLKVDPNTPDTSKPIFTGESVVNLNSALDNARAVSLVAADTQGRSYVLGAPTKVVLEHASQPTVVTAMPPMHVDFIPPAGEEQPTVLNVSAIPGAFNAFYDAKETSSNQSTTTDNVGWSVGAKLEGEGTYSIGPPLSNVEVSVATKAAYNHKASSAQIYGTHRSYSFNASSETGFADQVWYSDSRTNIWIYEIIGKKECPATKPNCQDSEKVPLTVQFSGDDQISNNTAGGDVLEWYQPPWEYGNLFSYPGSYSQLQKILPRIQKLSGADQSWATDSSVRTEKSNWSSDTSEGQNTSYQNNFSEDVSVSVSAKVGVKGTFSAEASAKLSVSGSQAFGSMTKSLNKLGESTGIGVKKPGTFLDPPNYAYFVSPYILGQAKPPGTPDDPGQTTAPETYGFIRTAFTVDPLRTSAGGWWRQAYGEKPDVALNHPTRWDVESRSRINPLPKNCRPITDTSSTMNCAQITESFPANPWISMFHHMRGFFISDELSPGSGAQLGSATAGDRLHLQARVYNYSLKEMPPNSRVHVRFYLQPWISATQRPDGDSVLVGEDILSPIPPFSNDPNAPLNWVLAKTTFDTTPYANKDVTFWVVVWIDDGTGKMVPEIASHGLKSIPGTLKSLADVQPEDYSNNVGFYKYVFHVFPPAASAALAVSFNSQPAEVGGKPVPVNIGKVDVSASRMELGHAIEVSASLTGANGSESNAFAVFYDGDPRAGGKAFDVERANHIAAGGSHLVKVLYRPTSCGVHELFVAVGRSTKNEVIRRAAPVRVECSASSGLAQR